MGVVVVSASSRVVLDAAPVGTEARIFSWASSVVTDGIPGCVLSQCWGTGRGRRWRFWGIVEAWRVFGALAAALSPEGPRHRGGPLARTFNQTQPLSGVI